LLSCNTLHPFVYVGIVMSYIPESFVSFINVYKLHCPIHVKEKDTVYPEITAENLKVLTTQHIVSAAGQS